MSMRSKGVPRSRRASLGVAAVAILVGSMVPTAAAAQETDPRFGLRAGTDDVAGGNAYDEPNADAETATLNMEHLANRPKPRWTDAQGRDSAAGAFSQSNIASDMAFTGDHAIAGNYRGFGIYNVSDPANPQLETFVNCVGGQGDPSVFGDLLFISVESSSARVGCDNNSADEVFRGIRIFDISDMSNPQYVAGIQTCRGSHTNTVVEDPNDDSVVYIYNSGTAGVRSATQLAHCTNSPSGNNPASFLDADGNPILTSRFMVEVIEVPLDAPEDARVINEARLFEDRETGNQHGLWAGGNHGSGTQSTSATDACHDMTAYPEIGLLAGACEGNGLLIDISDPRNPERLEEVMDPSFAYWHSATFNNDGTKVLFTDEWGGGVQPRCRTTDPETWGANAIFDVVQTSTGPKLELASYYKVPNVQSPTEVCVAHNGNLMPVPGRDIYVQAWYEGGITVFDFTDSSNPVEIAYFDRGPYSAVRNHWGGYWAAYWYGGAIYGNEIFLGFDSFELTPSDMLSRAEIDAATEAGRQNNPQAQERYTWEPSFAVAGSYLAQAERAGDISIADARRIGGFLERAERFKDGPQRRAALAQLDAVVAQFRKSSEAPQLLQAIDELRATL